MGHRQLRTCAAAGGAILLLAAIALARQSPEQRALRATVGIACPECQRHSVATAVYIGEGRFLTAYHCAPHEGQRWGLLVDGRLIVAVTERVSAPMHLSMLRMDGDAAQLPLVAARIARGPQLRIGTRVFEVGCPDGIPLVVLHGRVAKLDWDQTVGPEWPQRVAILNAPAAPGSSGGGVFLQRTGNLVGIHLGSNPGGDVSIVVRWEDIREFLNGNQ